MRYWIETSEASLLFLIIPWVSIVTPTISLPNCDAEQDVFPWCVLCFEASISLLLTLQRRQWSRGLVSYGGI